MLRPIVVLCLWLLGAPAVAGERVTTALIFAVDVSGSVNEARYELQKQGIAAAIRDPDVVRIIEANPDGGLGCMLMEWSDAAAVTVPWTIIRDRDSAEMFAAAVVETRRTSSGSTAIGSALAAAVDHMAKRPFQADRLVIDVSGDGKRNSGMGMHRSRELVEAAGITVNGLAIMAVELDLDRWYQAEVIQGPGAFVMPAETWEDFQKAMLAKLIAELW